MRQALVLLALVAAASAALKGGLRAKYSDSLSGLGNTSFYDLPRTCADAQKADYTKRERLAGLHLPSLELYCPSPAVLCLLFDDTGYIAGMQVGVDSAKFTPHFDLETMGMKQWKTNEGTYWIITEYFVSEAFLATDKATRIANRDSNILQTDSVWLTGTYGKIYEAPRDMNKIRNTKFLKEACTSWMGQHYFYNMSSTTECTSEGIFPWFVFYHSGQLVGVGFLNYGPLEIVEGERNWFERPDQAGVEDIVISGPQCLYDISAKSPAPGALSMHTYFVDQPWKITC